MGLPDVPSGRERRRSSRRENGTARYSLRDRVLGKTGGSLSPKSLMPNRRCALKNLPPSSTADSFGRGALLMVRKRSGQLHVL